MNRDNTWVTSLGGPLILVPQSAGHHWGGAPPTYPDNEGDYGRACEVDGYVGLIGVGAAQALVLGDMPARTTFLPRNNILIREIAGDEADADLPALVTRILPDVTWQPGPVWTVTEPVILFDSVHSWEDMITEEHLIIDLPKGDYLIEAGYIETPSEYLILVRFLANEISRSPGLPASGTKLDC